MSKLRREKVVYKIDLGLNDDDNLFKSLGGTPNIKTVNGIFETDVDDENFLRIPIDTLYSLSEAKIESNKRGLSNVIRGGRYGIPVSMKETTYWRYKLTAMALSKIEGKFRSISSVLESFFFEDILTSLSKAQTSAVSPDSGIDREFKLNEIKQELKIIVLAREGDDDEYWEDNIPDLTFHLIPCFRTLLLCLAKPEYINEQDLIEMDIFSGFMDSESENELSYAINNIEFFDKKDLRKIFINMKINFSELWKFVKNEKEVSKPSTRYIKKNKLLIANLSEDALKGFEKRFLLLQEIIPKTGRLEIEYS